MMESLNRTVEHSVSWRALQWRWTALRTGKPFAEIVLLNTLEYRVEQVFLIHTRDGPAAAASRRHDPRAAQDADQISAMLTAIRDFVARFVQGRRRRDTSTRCASASSGVIVEQGPHAILAGVVRGAAPDTLRDDVSGCARVDPPPARSELQAFHGDCRAVRARRGRCSKPASSRSFGATRAVVVSARRLALAAAVVLPGGRPLGVPGDARAAALERLPRSPQRRARHRGLAQRPAQRQVLRRPACAIRWRAIRAALVAASGLMPDAVESRWEPYQALHPPFVAARAHDLLRPPPGVDAGLSGWVLTASGSAPGRWIVESERLAPAIAGVRQLRLRGDAAGTPPEGAARGDHGAVPEGPVEYRARPGRRRSRPFGRLLTELNDDACAGAAARAWRSSATPTATAPTQ